MFCIFLIVIILQKIKTINCFLLSRVSFQGFLSKHLGAAHWLASFFTTDMYTIDNLDSAIHGFKSLLGSESERHKWAKERKSKANKVQAYFAGMKESSWSNVYSMRFGQFFISLYKAAGSPHSGYTYIYRRLLYWSYTEGRGSILHRLQKTTLIEPHLQVSEISRERMGWGGNSTREEGSEGRGEMMQSESLTRLPNNLTLEKTYRFHAQCILNRSREEPFTINICIFREPTYIKKWLKKNKNNCCSVFIFLFSLSIFSPFRRLQIVLLLLLRVEPGLFSPRPDVDKRGKGNRTQHKPTLPTPPP